MGDLIKTCLFLFGMAFILFFIAVGISKHSCHNLKKISGYNKYEYTILNGCFVEIDGRMISVDLLRAVDNIGDK